MKGKRKVDVPLAVLRGVVMHAQPHALVRPGRPAQSTVPRSMSPVARKDAEAAVVPSRKLPADERALAGERQAGYAAGRAAAAAEGEQALRTAIDQARSHAIEEGRLQGLAEGREIARIELEQAHVKAVESANAELARRIDHLDALLSSISAAAEALLAGVEDELIALSHEVVCRVLGESAATPAALRDMVKHLLASNGQRAQLAIHIHPDDLAALQLEGIGADAWRWVGDNNVHLGGVILRSPEGSLDARLETQLDALRDTLLRVRSERRAASLSSASKGRPA